MAGQARRCRIPKETEMLTPSTPEAPLSPPWAFVVQLREGTALMPQSLRGRVEHIASGRVTTFCSLGALLASMARVLTPPAPAPPDVRCEPASGAEGGRRVSAAPQAHGDAGVLCRRTVLDN